MIIRKNKHKKLIIIIAVGIVLIAGAGVAFALGLNHSRTSTKPAVSPDDTVNKVNYNPPTKQEQQAGDEQKQQEIIRQQEAAQPTPSHTAQVVVTDASYQQFDGNVVEVRAYVSNLIEDGGQCTATLTLGGQTVTQTSAGFGDATTTQCTTISIPRDHFPTAGTWQVVVSYSSSKATGQSDPTTVVIK